MRVSGIYSTISMSRQRLCKGFVNRADHARDKVLALGFCIDFHAAHQMFQFATKIGSYHAVYVETSYLCSVQVDAHFRVSRFPSVCLPT